MPLTYEPIATTTLSAGTASVTFSSIPQNYTDLILIQSSIGTSADSAVQAQFNNDTGASYSVTRLYGNGTIAASNRYTSQTSCQLGDYQKTSSEFAIYISHIMNYSSSTIYKSVLCRSNTASSFTALLCNTWRVLDAITTIKLFPGSGNFSSGSTFTLYGVKSA